MEVQKWGQQREALEAAHLVTEQELAIARQAQTELEDQKQENLVLKETIDRLRFDLDELRTRENAGSNGPSATTSQFGSVSKSLGAELMNRWESLGQEEEVAEEAEEEEEEEDSGTDGEEMIQTIITRKKRVRGRKLSRRYILFTHLACVEDRQCRQTPSRRSHRYQGVFGCIYSARRIRVRGFFGDTDRTRTETFCHCLLGAN
jgi:hypothetical protein